MVGQARQRVQQLDEQLVGLRIDFEATRVAAQSAQSAAMRAQASAAEAAAAAAVATQALGKSTAAPPPSQKLQVEDEEGFIYYY